MDSLQLVKGAAHAKHISLPTPKLKFCARQEGLLTGGTGVLAFFYGGYRKVFRAQRGASPPKKFLGGAGKKHQVHRSTWQQAFSFA